MASDVLCLCIMIAAADLFLGFATSFQQVYALAQCEGDLSNVDCSNCVTQAVQPDALDSAAPSNLLRESPTCLYLFPNRRGRDPPTSTLLS